MCMWKKLMPFRVVRWDMWPINVWFRTLSNTQTRIYPSTTAMNIKFFFTQFRTILTLFKFDFMPFQPYLSPFRLTSFPLFPTSHRSSLFTFLIFLGVSVPFLPTSVISFRIVPVHRGVCIFIIWSVERWKLAKRHHQPRVTNDQNCGRHFFSPSYYWVVTIRGLRAVGSLKKVSHCMRKKSSPR